MINSTYMTMLTKSTDTKKNKQTVAWTIPSIAVYDPDNAHI